MISVLFGGKFHCLFNIVQSIVWRWLMYRIAIGIRSGERHLHWDWSDSMNENAITVRNLLNDPELFGGKFHCVFDIVVSNVWRWIVCRIAIGIRSGEWSLHWYGSDSMNENTIAGRNLLNDPELFGGKFHCLFNIVQSIVWRWLIYRIAIGIRSGEWSLHWDWSDSMNEITITG